MDGKQRITTGNILWLLQATLRIYWLLQHDFPLGG